jgi:hypothetical protein
MSCESIIAAATAPTVTRCLMACRHAHNAASARKLARKNLSSSGRTATTISRDEMSNPLLVDSGAGLTPTGTRCCGCLTARLLGSPHSRRNGSAQTEFVDCCKVSNWPLRPTRPISGRNDAKLKGSDVALGTTPGLAPLASVWPPGRQIGPNECKFRF